MGKKNLRKWILFICLFCGLVIIMPANLQAAPKVSAPKLKSVKGINYNSIKVTWERSKNAAGYIIYRNNSILATVKGGKKTTFTDKTAQVGKRYTYFIKAFQAYKNSMCIVKIVIV